ncbi:MAG: alpha/beta hydrolase [Azonexaceae bacterium]|nr:alpha/beta hydrolase [Azonexaceae bacterium]
MTLAGKEDADQTIVFVNGLGYDQSAWTEVAKAFQEEYRLVSLDHVGSVTSNFADFRSNRHHYINATGYAKDLVAICSALGVNGKTILVGHSIGAIVAMLASIQSPAQFSRLILVGASPRYLDHEGYSGGFCKSDIDAIYAAVNTDYQSWASVFAAAATGENNAEHAKQFAASLTRIPQDMMLTVLCSILQADHRLSLPKVSLPTLIVQSKQDNFVPLAVAEYLHARIPNSQLNVIDAAGHLPHITAPDILSDAIRRFIESP